MSLTATQQNQIDTARRMLLTLAEPPAVTVAAILAEHGCRDDDDQEHAPGVALSRGQHRGATVALDAGVQVGAAIWQQVAVTGDFRGYRDGPFSFTADTFNRIVANFRASPQYGTAAVVPWDVAHQSVNAGNPPEAYAAVGWIRELEVRPAPQGAALWALTTWTDAMAAAIRAGEFAFASVVVQFDAVDPRSGANVGPMLESVAVTNTPFIPDLQRLAATRHGAKPQGIQPMQLTMKRSPDGAVTLGKTAEIGPNNGHFAQSATDNPPRNGLPNLDETFWQEVIGKARTTPGFLNQSAQAVAAWLRSVDPTNILKHDDRNRCAILVGTLLRTLAIESKPVGTNARQPAPIATQLSVIDARDQPGATSVQRAIMGLGAVSPRFAAEPFESKVALAGEALRQGRVIA
jgi:Mu-like prophage I protein